MQGPFVLGPFSAMVGIVPHQCSCCLNGQFLGRLATDAPRTLAGRLHLVGYGAAWGGGVEGPATWNAASPGPSFSAGTAELMTFDRRHWTFYDMRKARGLNVGCPMPDRNEACRELWTVRGASICSSGCHRLVAGCQRCLCFQWTHHFQAALPLASPGPGQ